MYRFAKITIYLEFAFLVTIFDILKLIIDYEVWSSHLHKLSGGHWI